jgi:N6-L-threonylcarbamoyladenine synthase
MIAWNGIELFNAGWKSELPFKSLRKWSIDPNAPDGGILGATDWSRHYDAAVSMSSKV